MAENNYTETDALWKVVNDVKNTVHDIKNVLVGNKDLKEDGFIQRTNQMGDDHEKRIKSLEDDRIDNKWAKKIIWFLITTVILQEAGYIIFLSLKK